MRLSTRLSTRLPTSAQGYAIASGVSLAVVILQCVLSVWTGDRIPFIFVLPAMAFVAVTLGQGPAFMVMAAGAANAMVAAARSGGWHGQPAQGVAVVLSYLAVGVAIVVYGNRLRLNEVRALQAERRLSMAQEQTGVGVFELDFQANKAFLTPTLCQMMCQPVMNGPVDLDQWLSQLSSSHRQETERVLQEKVDRGELRYEREQRIALTNGEIRWFLNRVNIEVTADGKLARAKGAAVDITERKRLDELLREAERALQQQVRDWQRLHHFAQQIVTSQDDAQTPLQALIELVVELHAAQCGMVWLAQGVFAGFRVVAQTGFAHGDAGALLPTDDPGEAAVALHRAAAARGGFASVHVIPLRGSSGGVIGFMSVLFAEPHQVDEREVRLGEVLSATATALVERDEARAKAAINERRFTVALAASVVPFTILAPVRRADGTIADFEWAYLNPSAARGLGVDASACVGRPVSEVLKASWTSSDTFARYVGVVERGESCDFEVESTLLHRNGWLQITACPLEGCVAIWFTDITEQKRQRQDLLDADRRKDEFLATLAHELRNPLAPIRQAVLVSRSPASTARQKQWGFDVVERQVKNMATLLDDLLDVSRITRGTLELHKSRVPLAQVIDAALETARPHLDAKKHRLTVDLPSQPWTVEVDALRLSQVIGNLLTNAAKYTDPGGAVRLSAQAGPLALEIRITDNGVGLTPDQFARLFEMFSQMPASAGRAQGGLGIGLALSKGILKLHGGQIDVTSPGPGLGSEFTVRLPAGCLPDDAAPEETRDDAPGDIHTDNDTDTDTDTDTGIRADAGRPSKSTSPPRTPARRVMVADDNVDAAESLAEMLRLDGHDVHVSYDGEQALAAFRHFQPDVALLDVGMPRMSGLEVARAIRSLPFGRDATLIAVTGWGQVRDQALTRNAGFDHHATKPVHPARIRALIAGLDVEATD